MSRLLPTIARSLLGLLFLVFGLNGFLNFLPMPPHRAAPASSSGRWRPAATCSR
ncbi:hypothetical protein [Nannocystis pusilla]|uniref:hypothetical protein n=1 Tax=Nannocystis pusilla TaxID=889268 RepID=UPI003B7838CB